ncbi:hypothetical protein [Chthonobacter rhizosphaerae]|uniref:hypothetical protein n=1 Tax=Chthonobacter rhizosphaerae TaxID=2735553 RepID=UPI0015EE62D7|nr:hypothetical protein [Chthonobacter rhizosphaerae]
MRQSPAVRAASADLAMLGIQASLAACSLGALRRDLEDKLDGPPLPSVGPAAARVLRRLPPTLILAGLFATLL